jgi:hypothetical protein
MDLNGGNNRAPATFYDPNGAGTGVMTTELNKIEARQADRRKMNLVALGWGLGLALLLLAALGAGWALS